MRRAGAAISIVIALAVPGVLLVNGIRVLANDWYVRFEIGRLPDDRYGFTTRQRENLALVGLHSIEPGGEGMAMLRRARLPSGRPAFDRRELRHLEDVRRIVGGLYVFHVAAISAIAALAVVFAVLGGTRRIVPAGLYWGGTLTVALGAAAGVLVLTNADSFLTGFHELFFEGSTWRFGEDDTLRRLYPDRFWRDTSVLLAVGAAVQALALVVLGRRWRRRTRLAAPTGQATPERARKMRRGGGADSRS